jgi:hypothetical protein
MAKSAVELMNEATPKSGRRVYPYADRAYICNILDMTWGPLDFDYGRFIIAPRAEGKAYQVTEITARLCTMDHGEKSETKRPIGALDIAHDIVRIINENAGSTDELTGAKPFLGVFVIAEGNRPTPAELEEAEEKLKLFCEHFIGVADMDFQTHGQGRLLPGFARKAAKILNVEKPWAVDTTRMVNCIGCQKGVSPNAVRCPHCQAILDEPKARKLYPHLFIGVPVEAPKQKTA